MNLLCRRTDFCVRHFCPLQKTAIGCKFSNTRTYFKNTGLCQNSDMSRHDLTDDQWVMIEPLISKKKSARGRPCNDDRWTLNGILYVLHTGCAWADLPKNTGYLAPAGDDCMSGRRTGRGSASGAPFEAVSMPTASWHRRTRRWTAASFRRKRGSSVGKTKVGTGSKVIVVVDGTGVPIGLHVDSTQPHELALAKPTLRTIRVPRNCGRPKTRPKKLVADKAYDSAEFRCTLRRQGITPTMPPIERRNRKKPQARTSASRWRKLPATLEGRALCRLDGRLSAVGGAL